MTTTAPDRWKAIRRLNRIGIAALIVLVGGVGGWAATAKLSGAVIASGVIVVELNLRKVQHPTGGIVSEILVKQGSVVKEGEVVMRLDDTIPRSTLGVVRSQLDELSTRQARLLAERDGADHIAFDENLISRSKEKGVAAAIAGEEKLFESRRKVRNGQRSQLQERIVQINEEIRGLSAQREAKESELGLIAQELKGVAELYAKNLVSISRFMVLQRDQARIQGERGQLIADTARARGRVSETELQILQLDQEFRNDVLKELREIEGKIAELRERFTAAEDQLKRVDIRAPESGVVHQLAVHTVGGVIANGETIMMIVPQADKLVVEAKVMPHDIDQITVGAHVLVRIMAGNQRTNPDVTGVVASVSADLTHDPQPSSPPGPAYYLVRIELSQDSVHLLKNLQLVPGMPAEAFIQTTFRTPLGYLLKPLSEQIARAFRER